jgi:hypothetical protein
LPAEEIMMVGRWLIGLAATLAAAGVAAAQNPPAAPPQPAQPLAACEGQRFEFKAGAEPHATKITLCSKKDASKDELVRMLDSAAAKIQALDKLPEEKRAALVAQLKAKIMEVEATNAVTPALPLAMPVAPPIPTPIPTPIPAKPLPIAAKPLPVAVRILTKPRLTLECFTPGEVGSGGPCLALERETLLTVRADNNLAAGTGLRFVRKGRVRGELTLAQMRTGQSRRMKMPRELCSGGGGGEVEIQLLNGGAVVDTLGRYQLRC